MNLTLSAEVNQIINYSREEAMRLGNYLVEPEHFMLGIIRHEDNAAMRILSELSVNARLLKQRLEEAICTNKLIPLNEADKLMYSKLANYILHQAFIESTFLRANAPEAIHLLLALVRSEKTLVGQLLAKEEITYRSVFSFVSGAALPLKDEIGLEEDELINHSNPSSAKKDPTPVKNTGAKKKETPIIDHFSTDLTACAAEGKLDPVVGREKEIERLAQILTRRKKNNPILIGEPGVGKSAIVEGLALRIAQKKVSRILLDKRIIAMDVASIVAGTKYRGQFEERMKDILNELLKAQDIILFIDEIHTIVGAGGPAGSLDAANILKPALARGELQCIGATTLDEYRESIERDGALERRFQKIIVDPTSPEETLAILASIKDRYEAHHNVKYTPEALQACVTLTQRYITDRCLPDKAIDALDEAGSRMRITHISVPPEIVAMEQQLDILREQKREAVKQKDFLMAAQLRARTEPLEHRLERENQRWKDRQTQHRETVDAEQVAEVVSMIANVPIHRIAEAEGVRLLKMSDELKKRVIGQDEAIDKVVRAIRRNRAGLKDPNKPIGTFIFLGPTGVGKTQLAKELSEYLFDSDDNMIRIDMSEYMEKHSVSRLIGAPPGYVGYAEGGQLTERIRRKPYSVVLLDEIEKSHPDIFSLLLQVLDEGRLSDSNGRHVDFRNTVLIMTSNIGSRELNEFGQGVGFATSSKRESVADNARAIIEKALQRTFTPEFLNRVDEQILFNPLNRDTIFKIIDIELDHLYRRIRQAGYDVEITDEAKNFVAEQGYDTQYGARPLKRAIQKYLEDNLAEAIIRRQLKPGEKLTVALNDDKNDVLIELQKELINEL
ncbi:MAG: ATP-dependent Clp protease ATP-binding subunit [Prevotellaceae bacterium]|jgi:ATP-dependent Clp protease ATP-binding subunit ClpC|nr:ATP-dependent Clp protease ATP-binding subunit [Prevotellaceae bacterium]